MTGWHEGAFLALDTETTGVKTAEDRIVQAAAVEINPDGTVARSHTWVINPGVEVPADVAEIHGFTTERLAVEGADPAAALTELAAVLQTNRLPVVVYNARFDIPLIVTECARHNVELGWLPLVLDPFVIDKAYDRYRRGSRKLVDVAAHYGVEFDADDAHGALADATAAGRLMHALVDRYPALTEMTLVQVFARTCRHAELQRSSFEDYMRTQKDPSFTSPQGWPLPAGSVA